MTPLVLTRIRPHLDNLVYVSWLRPDDEEEGRNDYEVMVVLMNRLRSAELLQKLKDKGARPLLATKDKSKFPFY